MCVCVCLCTQVVQPRLTDEQAAKLKLPSIKNYLQYVQQRRIVLFKPFAQHSGANKAAQGPAVVLTPPSQPNSQGATAAAANGVAADGAQPAANSTGAEGAAAAGPQQPPGEFLLELRNEMSYAEVRERSDARARARACACVCALAVSARRLFVEGRTRVLLLGVHSWPLSSAACR